MLAVSPITPFYRSRVAYKGAPAKLVMLAGDIAAYLGGPN